MISQGEVKEYLRYDDVAGVFFWIKGYRNSNVGKMAGFIDHEGYRQIKFRKRIWRSHHLVWLYHYGVLPDGVIDHIDGNRANNLIANLRVTTFAGNSQNQRKANRDSTHGRLGVDKLSHRDLFRARIMANGKRLYLGYFKTADEAHAAYLDAKRIHHSTCTI